MLVGMAVQLFLALLCLIMIATILQIPFFANVSRRLQMRRRKLRESARAVYLIAVPLRIYGLHLIIVWLAFAMIVVLKKLLIQLKILAVVVAVFQLLIGAVILHHLLKEFYTLVNIIMVFQCVLQLHHILVIFLAICMRNLLSN